MLRTQMPKCPRCGGTDFTDEEEELERGTTSYQQTCSGCGREMLITRRVEVWYETSETGRQG
jgi:DnaJ-class molecular chaperone